MQFFLIKRLKKTNFELKENSSKLILPVMGHHFPTSSSPHSVSVFFYNQRLIPVFRKWGLQTENIIAKGERRWLCLREVIMYSYLIRTVERLNSSPADQRELLEGKTTVPST